MGLDRSASKTGLLLGCQYSFRADVDVPESNVGEAAHRGTRIHDGIENDTDLPHAGEQGCINAARAWLETHQAETPAAKEVAYAWDGESSTVIGTGREAYANAPEGTLMTGTADIIVTAFDGVTVADWKSSEQSASKAHEQLMTLAVMAGADHKVAIELREDGTYVEHGRTELMPWDLEVHAEKLRTAIAAIPNAQPTPGDHCGEHYCPLRGTCPAYQETVEHVAELVPAGALVRRKLTEPLVTTEDVAVTLPLLDMVEDWLKATREKAKAICLENGGELRLDEKTVWRKIESSRQSVRGQDALELAKKLGASQDELAALTYTTKFDVFKRIKKAG